MQKNFMGMVTVVSCMALVLAACAQQPVQDADTSDAAANRARATGSARASASAKPSISPKSSGLVTASPKGSVTARPSFNPSLKAKPSDELVPPPGYNN